MIKWKIITFNDKARIENFYARYHSEVSDYNFAQLLLWQKAYNIHYAIIDSFLVVRLKSPYEKQPYIHMPVHENSDTNGLKNLLLFLKADFESQGYTLRIKSVTRSDYLHIRNCFKDAVSFKLLRDEYEYIYPANDLSKLDTKNLKRKKTMLTKFKRLHNYKLQILSDEHLLKLRDLIEMWYESNKDPVLEAEKNGILSIFEHWYELDLKGCILIVDSQPVAFSFGLPITDKMFLVLIEKAKKEIKGAYVALIQGFAEMYGGEYIFSNREEDLGITGLRKAKMLYRPCRFIEKGVIDFK